MLQRKMEKGLETFQSTTFLREKVSIGSQIFQMQYFHPNEHHTERNGLTFPAECLHI